MTAARPMIRWEQAPEGPAAAIAAAVAGAVPELATPRLRLRAPRVGDFALYAATAATGRGVHLGGPMTIEDAALDFAQMVASWMLHGHGVWSVESRADSRLLGFVLLGLEPADPEPELGWLLAADAEGQGYATEAAVAARDFARDRLGWTTCASFIAPDNLRSIRLAERLGARPEPGSLDGSLVWRHDLRSGA